MPAKLRSGRKATCPYLPVRIGIRCFRCARTGYQLVIPNERLGQGAAIYTDDDEIGRAVAADLEECWQGEGWYRICFTDGMGSYPATWYGTEADLADDLRGAYGDAGEIHLPYAEISVIDQAVEKVWQGEGWYRVTGGDGEKWEPDFYVTRECLVAALRDAYDEASFSGAICVPRVEPAPDPNRRRTHAF